MARELDVADKLMVINIVPQIIIMVGVSSQGEQACSCEVGVVLPHSEKIMVLACAGIVSCPVAHTDV